MKKINFIFLLVILITSTVIGLFIWDKIYIPTDGYLVGYEAIKDINYHPKTDTLRFVVFIFVSLIPFYLSLSKLYKTKFLSLKEIIVLDQKNFVYYNYNIFNYVFYILIFATIFSFFLIDFDNLVNVFDIYHEGLYLTPSINYFLTGKFWSSSFIERGMFGNYYPLIFWSFFENNNSIGLGKFSSLVLLLFNKLLLIYLARQITLNINFDKIEKIIFFILLSAVFLSFVDYYDTSHFPTRYPLYLLFFNIFLLSITNLKRISLPNVFVGLFSMISILWWLDIGIFINIIIFLTILLSLLKKDYIKIISIFIGVFSGWLLFFIIMPNYEIEDFLTNTFAIISSIELINQIPYPSPLLGDDGRATKTLIYFVLAGAFTIHTSFLRKSIISNQLKIFLLFLYVSSLISFQYGLIRSDSFHIQMSTGLLLVSLSSLLLIYFFTFYKSLRIYFKKIIFFISLLAIFFQLNLHKSHQIIKFPERISKLVYAEDKEFLQGDIEAYISLIDYYKEISAKDNCVQIFTDEVALPFLIKKKSCTKFNIMMITSPKKTQIRFINELKKQKPNIILYNSDKFDFGYTKNLTLVNDYIKENYILHSEFDFWTFLKIK